MSDKHMRILDYEQIKRLAHGVARVEEGDDGRISFHRFTKEQQELYKSVSDDFYVKSFSTSGVSLEFDTDSKNLGLSVSISKGSSRGFFTHSIFVNGNRIGELSGEINQELGHNPFGKQFCLGTGMKRVRIQFPWSVASKLVALELDQEAAIVPIRKERTVLMFGDSITQGYDAYAPEHTYAVQIADYMNAEARNKGIGGEQFRSDLALLDDEIKPDVITVAYGTNDWAHSTKEVFEQSCKAFYVNLRNTYPKARIVALTPIWRADIHEKKQIGVPLCYITEYIKQVSKNISDMIVLDCINFVPHSPQFYQKDGLHPIDDGFRHYAKNLTIRIEGMK